MDDGYFATTHVLSQTPKWWISAPCLHVKLARTTLALTMRDVSQEVKVSKSSENRRYNPDVIPDVSVARGVMQGWESRY